MTDRTTALHVRVGRAVNALGLAAAIGVGAIMPGAQADGFDDLAEQIVDVTGDPAGSAAAVASDIPAVDLDSLGPDTLTTQDLHDLLPGAAATADTAPGSAAATPDTATVPLTVRVTTEPVITASIGGGQDIPVLVDSGANGMIVPWQDFGWQNVTGLPTNIGIGAFSGGMSYLYVTVPTSVDFGNGVEATDAPVNLVLFSWASNPTSITDILFPPTINSFLAGAADGIFGVGPNAYGPGPSLMDSLPGDLGQGVLIDQPGHTLSFGPADAFPQLADGTVVSGSPITDLQVSIDGGSLQSVKSIVDSGGVFGTMPSSVYSGAIAADGSVPAGTNIAVYTNAGDLLYSYNTGTDYPGPTVVGIDNDLLAGIVELLGIKPVTMESDPLMNTGNIPFAQGPIFIGQDGSGGSQTIFGFVSPNSN